MFLKLTAKGVHPEEIEVTMTELDRIKAKHPGQVIGAFVSYDRFMMPIDDATIKVTFKQVNGRWVIHDV